MSPLNDAFDLTDNGLRKIERDVHFFGPLIVLGQVVDRHGRDSCGVVGFAEQAQSGRQAMIDLAAETLVTIETAAQRLLVSKATLQRWISQGTKGIRLEAAKVGGCLAPSEEAIQRFSDCLTPRHDSKASQQIPVPTSKQRQRHLEQVNQRLDELFGIRRCETCKTEINSPNGVKPKHERLWCPKCLVQRKSAGLGQRIRTFRWAASLTQEDLSYRTGISIDNIRSYEARKKEPTEPHKAKLIEVLGEDLVRNYGGQSQGDPKSAEIEGCEFGEDADVQKLATESAM